MTASFYMGMSLNTWIGIIMAVAIVFSIPTIIYIYHRTEERLKTVVYYILFILISGMISYVMLGGNPISMVG
jgi:hypothetical protein